MSPIRDLFDAGDPTPLSSSRASEACRFDMIPCRTLITKGCSSLHVRWVAVWRVVRAVIVLGDVVEKIAGDPVAALTGVIVGS
jgi:hypothetical protein